MTKHHIGFVIVLLAMAIGAVAEDRYRVIAVSDLKTDPAVWENDNQANYSSRAWRVRGAFAPRVVVEGAAEAYVEERDGTNWRWSMNLDTAQSIRTTAVVAIRSPAAATGGTLYIPNPGMTGMIAIPFTLPDQQDRSDDKAEFERIRTQRYQRLLDQGLPGAAWFRHQLAGNPDDVAAPITPRPNEFDETFDLFSGNRALSENLQLDRAFVAAAGEQTIDIASIDGITVAAMDWKAKLADKKPQLDTLAEAIPGDQHAVFFPTFQALVDFTDQIDREATPILQAIEPHGTDARTRERYQMQLCLEMSEVARMFGPQLIDSVAITGSDPYLRIGSDVAILFAAKNAEAVRTFLLSKQALAAAADSNVKAVHGSANGLDYVGVANPSRGICSYLAVLGQTVVITNSLKQLEALQDVKGGARPGLSAQDEYRFFRDRYARGDEYELAFVVLTDATIRRWCSPRWRIADSRRARALAALSELQARHIGDLAAGAVPAAVDSEKLKVEGLGDLGWSADGVRSSVYNTAGFVTPVSELDITQVSQAEADAYKRFRDNYQNRWRGYFDPIALRFSKRENGMALDGTIMPLIAGSEYNDVIGVVGKAELPDGAGDRHPGTLFHLITAIDRDSRWARQVGTMGVGFGFQADPLGWLGKSLEIYVEDDPVWKEIAGLAADGRALEKNLSRMPIALRAEVSDALKLTVFLTALHGFADQSAPGLTKWDTLDHNGQPYVRIRPSDAGELGADFAIYYAVTPKSFVLSVNEALIKRALDRQAQLQGVKPVPGGLPPAGVLPQWLGKSMNLSLDKGVFALVNAFGRESGQDLTTRSQMQAWDNIPILNELRNLYPDQDPVALYEKLWHVRLVSPAGGEYTWSEQWHTMSSNVYGHPGEPLAGPETAGFGAFDSAHFGLTFEDQGLRAFAQFK